MCPEHHVEVAARERARSSFGDDHLTGPRRDIRVDFGADVALDMESGSRDGGESPVARADFRKAGAQRDDYVDDRDVGSPGTVYCPAQARQVPRAVVDNVHDGSLDIHHKKGAAHSISRNDIGSALK
ncbi:hypothetical protein GCM10009647_051600 [Streptomyces sanglieri]